MKDVAYTPHGDDVIFLAKELVNSDHPSQQPLVVFPKDVLTKLNKPLVPMERHPIADRARKEWEKFAPGPVRQIHAEGIPPQEPKPKKRPNKETGEPKKRGRPRKVRPEDNTDPGPELETAPAPGGDVAIDAPEVEAVPEDGGVGEDRAEVGEPDGAGGGGMEEGENPGEAKDLPAPEASLYGCPRSQARRTKGGPKGSTTNVGRNSKEPRKTNGVPDLFDWTSDTLKGAAEEIPSVIAMPFLDMVDVMNAPWSRSWWNERCTLWEIYSVPRLGPHVRKLGGTCRRSYDIQHFWDLGLESYQRTLLQDLATFRPFYLSLSPPCTYLCKLMASNWSRMRGNQKFLFLRDGLGHACEDETELDPNIARALFDSQDGGCTSEAPTIHSEVMLNNKEKLFDLAYAEFKSPWCFGPRGIAAILNDLSDKSSPNTSSVELLTAVEMGEQRVMAQAFELLMSELDFDVKSWRVNLLSWPEKISAGSAVELDGVQLSNTSAIYIVDYVPVVGDFAHAALTLSTSLNVPVRYAGLPDPAHQEWLQELLAQDLIDQLLTDKIKPTAGHAIPAQDPPAEHMDQKPEPPQMKKMTFVKVDGEAAGIQVPDSVQKVNDLIFAPRLDEEKAGQTTCAKAVAPAMKWESAWTGFAWHMKQTQTGLQPQRLVIVATKSVEIKPGMTLMVDTV
eukprot:s2845_g12.t1